MKIDVRLIAVWILFSIIVSAFILGSVGCSATYHLNRYQAKGGVCGKIDSVKVIDSVPYLINDTVVYRYFYKDSLYIVNDRVVPKTRYELRTEYKIHRDTIRLKETVVKENTKVEKSEDRKLLVWLAMAFLAVVAIYLIKKG